MKTTKLTFTNLELFAVAVGASFINLNYQRFASLVLPPSAALYAAKNLKQLNAAEECYNETRKKLIEEVALKDDKGQFVKTGKDNKEYSFETEEIKAALLERLKELDQAPITLDIIVLPFESISKVEGVSGQMLLALEQFFKDDASHA
jgi:hypothetical protein